MLEFTVDSSHWSLFRLECAEYECGSPSCLEIEDMHSYDASTECEMDSVQPAYGNSTMHTEDWNDDADRYAIDDELLHSEPELTYNQWRLSL